MAVANCRVNSRESEVSLRQDSRQLRGLIIHAWCLMTNHIHLIISSDGKATLSDILRDFKKFTSSAIIKAMRGNIIESRKKWMLRIFEEAGRANRKTLTFNSGSMTINRRS